MCCVCRPRVLLPCNIGHVLPTGTFRCRCCLTWNGRRTRRSTGNPDRLFRRNSPPTRLESKKREEGLAATAVLVLVLAWRVWIVFRRSSTGEPAMPCRARRWHPAIHCDCSIITSSIIELTTEIQYVKVEGAHPLTHAPARPRHQSFVYSRKYADNPSPPLAPRSTTIDNR